MPRFSPRKAPLDWSASRQLGRECSRSIRVDARRLAEALLTERGKMLTHDFSSVGF